MVFSEGVHVSVGTFYMPGSMSDGQFQFFIYKDYNSTLSTSQIALKATAGKTIDGNSSVTLDTNGLVKRFCYVDGMLELLGR